MPSNPTPDSGSSRNQSAGSSSSSGRSSSGGSRRSPPKLTRIARFEVREALGGGAFGVVYRAYDPQLEREVAIKVPKPGTLNTQKRVERFLGDAKSAAQLRHPNIVPVFDCGKDGDLIYIASAYVRGQTLGDAIEPGPMEFRAAATVAMKLADALAYAHTNSIIHRDIKPDNIVLDLAGEPHIIDFGLAHRGGEAERGRSFFGTPSYMSPEQASGESGDAKPAFDQYALGITLYEMLTGKTPFSGPSKIQMFHHVNTTPPPLREMNPNIPLDLQLICMKALAKHQDNRYPDCSAMATDLRTWLSGGVPSVRTLTRKERLVRWVKTEPRLAGAVGIVGLLVVVLAILGASFGAAQRKKNGELTLANAATERARDEAIDNERRATENERKATDNESKAKAAEKTALDAKKVADESAVKARAAEKNAIGGLAAATFDRAVVVGEQGELGQCLTDLAKALVLAERAEDAELTTVIRQNLAGWRRQTHRLAEVRSLPTAPAWLVFDSVGKESVLYGTGVPEGPQHALVCNLNGEKVLSNTRVSLADTEGIATKAEEAATRTASTSPDGAVLLTISMTGIARVFDANSGERIGSKLIPSAGARFLSGAVFPDKKRIVLGDSRGIVSIFKLDGGDWKAGAKAQTPLLLAPEVRALAVHPLGTRVISGSGSQLSGQLVLWDAEQLKQIRAIDTALPVTAVAFSPRDGNLFVTGHGTLLTGEARAWAITPSGVSPGSVMRHQAEVNAVAFSKDGRFVATASQDRSARVFDCETWAAVGQPLWHGRDVRAVAFTPDGKQLVTGGDENAIRVWDLAPGPSAIPPLRVRDDAVLATAATPLAHRLFVGGVLKSKEWDPVTLNPLSSDEPLAPETVLAASYSPNGSQLALGCVRKINRTGLVLIRDHLRVLGPFEHPRAVLSVAFSPDGRFLATGCADGIARVWDIARTQQPLAELAHVNDGRVYVVRYSPDGNHLFTGGTDGRGLLWDAKGLRKTPIHTMKHPDGVLSVAFSINGKRMVTGYIGAALVWNWPDTTHAPVQDGPLLPHGPAGVFAVDISADGTTALTGGTDGTARLWDLKTRKPLGPMWRPGTTVKSVAFWPGDRMLASGTDLHAGTVLIIDKPPAVTQSTADVTLWVEVTTGISRDLAVLDPDEWRGSRRRFALRPAPRIEVNLPVEHEANRLEWLAKADPKPIPDPKIDPKKEPIKMDPGPAPKSNPPAILGLYRWVRSVIP